MKNISAVVCLAILLVPVGSLFSAEPRVNFGTPPEIAATESKSNDTLPTNKQENTSSSPMGKIIKWLEQGGTIALVVLVIAVWALGTSLSEADSSASLMIKYAFGGSAGGLIAVAINLKLGCSIALALPWAIGGALSLVFSDKLHSKVDRITPDFWEYNGQQAIADVIGGVIGGLIAVAFAWLLDVQGVSLKMLFISMALGFGAGLVRALIAMLFDFKSMVIGKFTTPIAESLAWAIPWTAAGALIFCRT